MVADGSIAGLAIYKLLKMQLLSIRNLPERRAGAIRVHREAR